MKEKNRREFRTYPPNFGHRLMNFANPEQPNFLMRTPRHAFCLQWKRQTRQLGRHLRFPSDDVFRRWLRLRILFSI